MHRLDFRKRAAVTALSTSLAAAMTFAVTGLAPQRADACGCLSPPDPVALGSDNFAVNQQAEQIIFEVGTDTVSAHVQIRYAGDPEQFAWIVPVPNAPDLEISHSIAFALLDEATSPQVYTSSENLCPHAEYACEYHPTPNCEFPGQGGSDTAAGDTGESPGDSDGADPGNGEPPSGVDVIDMQMVGSYETVTFTADDAALAVDWLHENGFIVNETMTPYMQPYIDGGMVFVAAKLAAGAGVDEIAPLKITYDGQQPMIPLQLTAVAAEPHMTVSAYIYSDETFGPVDHPLIEIDPARIATGHNNRNNYPMVLAASIDEAGGDAFVMEYEGPPVRASFPDDSGCCGGDDSDWCGIGDDTTCQCPGDSFDEADCAGVEGLLESITLLDELASQHVTLTRLTTRLSPEDMTFDPMFAARSLNASPLGRLVLQGHEYDLASCAADVIDAEAYAEIEQQTHCSATYCGEGTCVVSDEGTPGCDCNDTFTAKVFTDFDGRKSVTCVPEAGTVDLGLTTDLPDVCDGFSCGDGDCVAVGGFPTCDCAEGSAAIFDDALVGQPVCQPIANAGGDPGANNYTPPYQDLEVCAPAPPQCGEFGWLEKIDNDGIQGVMCESSIPSPEALVAPEPPTCEEIFGETATAVDEDGEDSAGGCSLPSQGGGFGSALLSMLLLGTLRLRRRR